MHKKITSESKSQHCHLLEVVICVTVHIFNPVIVFASKDLPGNRWKQEKDFKTLVFNIS